MRTKRLLSIMLLLSVCVAAALNVYNQSQTPQYSDVALANIEALGGDEPSGGEGGGGRPPACEAVVYCPYRNQDGQIEYARVGCAGYKECCASDGMVTCDGDTQYCQPF